MESGVGWNVVCYYKRARTWSFNRARAVGLEFQCVFSVAARGSRWMLRYGEIQEGVSLW